MKKKLSIIFTFYNDEDCIDNSIKEIQQQLDQISQIDYEIIFVNDNSTDNSYELLLEKRKRNKKIKIINLSRRFGHMAGIMAGLKNSTGDAAIYLDIDLQDPPDLIPKMVNYWLHEKYDVVYTTRKKSSGNNLFLKLLSKIGYFILTKFSNVHFDTNSGDFKLITRRVIDEYIKFTEADPFYRLIVEYIGFKKKQIFYERRKRNIGKSKFGLFSIFINFFNTAFFPFSDFPLRFAFVFGFLSFFFCTVVMIRTVYLFFFGAGTISTTSIFVAILFFAGIQSFITGILAMYIGMVHKETMKRPLYIIEESIGFEESNTEDPR